jgi:hypothetical protein
MIMIITSKRSLSWEANSSLVIQKIPALYGTLHILYQIK